MKRGKLRIYIAAGLFLTATAVRLAFPAATTGAIAELKSALRSEPTERRTTLVTINAGEFLAQAGGAEAQAVLAEPDPVEEAVAVFLAAQAPYADLDVPANVTYDVCQLPFACTEPVEGATSSGFGYRLHPLENITKFHYGTDMAANSGDDIRCFADGQVLAVGADDGYGNFFTVQHGDGFVSLYAHCGQIYVSEGQKVSAGEKVALVGATGQVTGPHLHFELTHDGVYMNPEFFLAAL